MVETLGTVDLKIARLERRLKVLEQQLSMSRPYPRHQLTLRLEYSRTRLQLNYFNRKRREFLQQPLVVQAA